MPAASVVDPQLLARLEALRLAVRHVQWGTRLGGRFVINRRGSSVEFADYAEYTPGDDIRTIDWNLYARLNRLFVKLYKEEIELSVEIIVDATASMALPTAKKFSRATELALCLAYIGLAGRHQVRLSWIASGRPSATAWAVKRADMARLTASAASAAPSGQISMAGWMQRAVAALRMHGGQAILITDGMVRPAEFFQAMHLLAMKHLEVKVVQVLTPEELQPARLMRGGRLIDSETGSTHELAYRPEELARAVLEHNEQLARFCKRQGIPWVQHRLDESLEPFLLKTLPMSGFLE